MNRIDPIAIGSVMVGFAMLIVIIATVEAYLDLPVVKWSDSQARCVAVDTPTGAGDCAALPPKYVRVIVK